jgi:8-oxo-dGTP pyrophosphatase MutT (NUDIX family)
MNADERAASLILVKGDKALMMLRDDKPGIQFPGMWAIVGGGSEPGESFKETAIRELEEETGYKATNPQLVMTENYYLPNGKLVEVSRFFEVSRRLAVLKARRWNLRPWPRLIG